MLNNKLAKLTIEAYENEQRTRVVKSFEMMFNPSSLSFFYQNKFTQIQGINTSTTKAVYLNTVPEKLYLELIIDSASIYSDDLTTNSVKKKVTEFLKVFVMQGNLHTPPPLKIYWGEMQWGLNGKAFDCCIETVDITYSLFARNGAPLRATLKTQFKADITEEARVRIEGKSSPDLTHTRIVSSDSSLPLLAQEIYQNPLFYLEVAKHNDLDNLREIKPGITLNFPPIKTDK